MIPKRPITEKQTEILNLLQRVIRNFNKKERYLIEHHLCERCICARFAIHMDRFLRRSQFFDYTVDNEYDRGMGGNEYGKKILSGHDAYLDLIVHKRGYDENIGFDNLFAIEMKWQELDFTKDKERLAALVDVHNGFGYHASFAIRIVSDPEERKHALEIEESFYNNSFCTTVKEELLNSL